MQMHELVEKALTVAVKYDKFNKIKIGRSWSNQELALGGVGDMGDFVKLVMAKEGVREIGNVDEKLEHEMSDILWVMFVLSKKYGINIEESFIKNMDQLSERVDKLIEEAKQ